MFDFAWARFWLTAVVLGAGLLCFAGAVLGNCRFAYVMNRVHAAGIGDAMGLFCVVLAASVNAAGLLEAVKCFLPVAFLWVCSPVSSHLIAQIEYYTNRRLYEHMTRL